MSSLIVRQVPSTSAPLRSGRSRLLDMEISTRACAGGTTTGEVTGVFVPHFLGERLKNAVGLEVRASARDSGMLSLRPRSGFARVHVAVLHDVYGKCETIYGARHLDPSLDFEVLPASTTATKCSKSMG